MCTRGCNWAQVPGPDAAVVTLGVLANIDVDDLSRAAEFYCSALGLRVGRRFQDSAVELLGELRPSTC